VREVELRVAETCFCLDWHLSSTSCFGAVAASNTRKINVAVSAVALSAGGTSIPALLSSYAIARNGHGDMAGSISIVPPTSWM